MLEERQQIQSQFDTPDRFYQSDGKMVLLMTDIAIYGDRILRHWLAESHNFCRKSAEFNHALVEAIAEGCSARADMFLDLDDSVEKQTYIPSAWLKVVSSSSARSNERDRSARLPVADVFLFRRLTDIDKYAMALGVDPSDTILSEIQNNIKQVQERSSFTGSRLGFYNSHFLGAKLRNPYSLAAQSNNPVFLKLKKAGPLIIGPAYRDNVDSIHKAESELGEIADRIANNPAWQVLQLGQARQCFSEQTQLRCRVMDKLRELYRDRYRLERGIINKRLKDSNVRLDKTLGNIGVSHTQILNAWQGTRDQVVAEIRRLKQEFSNAVTESYTVRRELHLDLLRTQLQTALVAPTNSRHYFDASKPCKSWCGRFRDTIPNKDVDQDPM